MAVAPKLAEIERIFLEDLVEDYEGIWILARRVSDAIDTENTSLIREITLEIARNMLISEMIVAGIPETDKPGFVPWEEKGIQAYRRLMAEWKDESRRLTLGDIVWFDLTEKGEEYLKKLPAA